MLLISVNVGSASLIYGCRNLFCHFLSIIIRCPRKLLPGLPEASFIRIGNAGWLATMRIWLLFFLIFHLTQNKPTANISTIPIGFCEQAEAFIPTWPCRLSDLNLYGKSDNSSFYRLSPVDHKIGFPPSLSRRFSAGSGSVAFASVMFEVDGLS